MKPTHHDRIRDIARNRDVQFLLHFTQAANLEGIVRDGLLPRRSLETTSYLAYPSDQFRLDGRDDVVSVSLSRINEGMFAAKRHRSGHSDWIILVLSAEILWLRQCIFCWRNAATKEIRDHGGRRDGPWAFEQMFAGSDAERRNLPESYPTDPEAEVQVMGRIDQAFILGAVVNRSDMEMPVQAILDRLPNSGLLVSVQPF